MPEKIREVIIDEISNYQQMQQNSSEANVIRKYIECLLSLPWTEKTEEINDLEFARETLGTDHFGIEQVKERIIEFLAQRQLSNSVKSQIICLVGPPGVGKSSIAKSIATATGRKLAKWKTNGVNDVAAVKGHCKTYVGAMPGKIIQQLKEVGSKNPVFLLDEIDKMGSNAHSGDPASAMLEVLDPDHNDSFTDDYVGESFDLSEVMFIATANYIEQIPPALKDRMEIIQLPGYTEEEKFRIAKDHMINKVLMDCGIKPEQLQFTDEAIYEIIRNHAKEEGVRDLCKILKSIARKFAVKHIEEKMESLIVTPQQVQILLSDETTSDQSKKQRNIKNLNKGPEIDSKKGNKTQNKNQIITTTNSNAGNKNTKSAKKLSFKSVGKTFATENDFKEILPYLYNGITMEDLKVNLITKESFVRAFNEIQAFFGKPEFGLIVNSSENFQQEYAKKLNQGDNKINIQIFKPGGYKIKTTITLKNVQ